MNETEFSELSNNSPEFMCLKIVISMIVVG